MGKNGTNNKFFVLILVLLVFTIHLNEVGSESARKKKKEAKVKGKTSSGCKIKLADDIPLNEPLYLLEKKAVYSLFAPTGKETIFKPKEEIILLCPGKQNTIASSKLNMTKLTCMDNKKFGINNKQVSFRTLNCTKEVNGDLRITDKTCGDGLGTLMEIGFNFNKKVFLKIFEVCYNTDTASALYSTHQIRGKVIQHTVPDLERRPFRTSGVPKGARPVESYKKATQITRFSEIFGENQQYFNQTSFLTKGQLTPESDFIFSSHQLASYFFINVAPQFNAINQGNWLQVEKLVRMIAQKHQSDLTIYTGTYDKLTLASERTGRRTLYLEENDKIEVPKWFWKIVHNETSDSAIVLMTLNNPHAKLVDAQSFCQNICSSVGLISHGLKSLKKGYTYCCELNDFRKTVTTVPSNLNPKNVLELSLSNISFG